MILCPIRISINALGGQGGGVLADWIVALAEAKGWIAQSTSVPGVAQRTGATVYYVEICPPAAEESEPVLALMPVPGDVDVVLALELMEAGRAIARGLVTPDRTTLIASTHRVFAIAEKSARGDGAFSAAEVLEACRGASKKAHLIDLQRIAERSSTMISAAMLGALAASAVLPFSRADFEAVVATSGRGRDRSLAAFAEAFGAVGAPVMANATQSPSRASPYASSSKERLAELPPSVRDIAAIGVERLLDYQGRRYAGEYLSSVARLCAAEAEIGAAADWRFSREGARRLALWMSYEDVARVADLKLRAARFERVKSEAGAAEGQVIYITEFMHPRFEEVCDILPEALGRALNDWAWARRAFSKWIERDWKVTTSRLSGYVLLAFTASLRVLRPSSYRCATEQLRIESWLMSAVNAARTDYDLGVEVLRLQRLVKGYGDTHARGLRTFATIMNLLPALSAHGDASQRVRALHDAALREDDQAFFGLVQLARSGVTSAPPRSAFVPHPSGSS